MPMINDITGDNFRYIPIHTLAQKSCEDICNLILIIHLFSQDANATSKAGTNTAALKANYHLLAILGQSRRHLKELKNAFVLFLTKKKIAKHLMIYGMFFIQSRTKLYDLCHLLLICHVGISKDHFMSI